MAVPERELLSFEVLDNGRDYARTLPEEDVQETGIYENTILPWTPQVSADTWVYSTVTDRELNAQALGLKRVFRCTRVD